ncbi:MAG: ABC transporter ATP-binding protein [Thermoanaerobacteraceae bacterium]|nr:ABC transporter ATP-binding protein [Thermoanaerobacteraceae bacterium]
MVVFEHVSKAYDNWYQAVKDLNLKIEAGELVTLIGPSGCGKTTTLKMVNRIIEPTSGTVYVNGKNVREVDPVKLRRGIGYVIQQIGLFPNMTIAENITVVGKLLGWSRRKCRERAEELLALVGMDPGVYMDRFPRELSGGQQQRIGVLRALAAEPEIILMDEPFGALDPITREQLQNELKRLQEKLHKTILFVTHDMDEALKLADRIVLMRDGEVVQVAPPDEMLRNPADEFVINFIGKNRLLRSPDEVRVKEVMITNPVTIEAGRGLAEALERMRKRHVDSLMVIDRQERFRGIVTIKDIQTSLSKKGTVGDLLSGTVIAVSPEQTVREAVYKMAEHGVGYLPVVDDEGKLQGLMTRASLVDILTDVLWAGGTTSKAEDEKQGGGMAS